VIILESEERLFEDLRKAVLNYDKDLAVKIAEKVLKRGINPLKAIEEGLSKGILEVGEKFGTELFLTDLIFAAETVKAALAVLEPALKATKSKETAGVVVIGTVKGDIHDIGKNLVSIMLSANGFKVIDIGVDVASKTFIRRAEEEEADIIAASSLLPTTKLYMDELTRLLKELNLRDKYKVLVGGGQVTAEFAEEIGADGYAKTAREVPALAKRLLGRR
jgi:corrinoid protein of di/trimethylamine methyltransferase